MTKTTTAVVPYSIANQKALDGVDAILNNMKQPMYQTADAQLKLKNDLKLILKEILETTQRMLLANAAGKPNGVKADMVGWTNADTDYDNEDTVKIYPHAKVVNKILRDLLKEQEEEANKQGVAVSQQAIINAQQDANNKSKDTITLETNNDPETGIRSKVEICKETGDTQMYRQDPETGIWKKIGNKLKNYWVNTKNFVKNVWGWVMKQYKRGKDWLFGLFKSPEDSQIIYVQAQTN